jgi:hypothetical protein
VEDALGLVGEVLDADPQLVTVLLGATTRARRRSTR